MSTIKDNMYEFFPDEMSNIESYLSTDFEKELFKSCFETLAHKHSKLRLNHFSSSLRELLRHVLERLSPDEQIRNCEWWQDTRGNSPEEQINPESDWRIYRAERMRYAIQGGISPNYVAKIGINIDEEIKQLIRAQDQLSKYTHVNESTFGISLDAQTAILGEILRAFVEFFGLISQFREHLIQHLEDNIVDAAVEQEMFETSQSLDLLASHYSTEEICVEKVKVIELNADYINIEIRGEICVMLQWGSSSDMRNDMGAEAEIDFPFFTQIRFSCSDPTDFTIEQDNFQVDTSKWYEGRYDNDDER